MKKKGCLPKEELRRGAWTEEEDKVLSDFIQSHGLGKWRSVPAKAGLNRCGKSCRLRWLNYLRPGIKRGNITDEEEELIIRLHKLLGNRWSLIAGRIPGRTDNEIKNYWNTYLKKKLDMDSSESQSSFKAAAAAAAATAITTTTQLSFKNPRNEEANERTNEGLETSNAKSKTIQSANDLSTSETEALNAEKSVIHEEHLTLKLQAHSEICPPAASDSSEFGFGMEFSFGELSNSSVYSGYGWRDGDSMNGGSSSITDAFNSKKMERNEEMHPFIAEFEWESLIKAYKAI